MKCQRFQLFEEKCVYFWKRWPVFIEMGQIGKFKSIKFEQYWSKIVHFSLKALKVSIPKRGAQVCRMINSHDVVLYFYKQLFH